MKTKPRSRHDQSGAMLLEALIAILIFSLGILAIIGLQAQSIRNSAEAKYRSDAAYLANQLIGRMWADRANLANYAHRPTGTTVCSPGGAAAGTTTAVGQWVASFTTTGTALDANKQILLPGATVDNQQVVIGNVVNNTRTVFIRICWNSPTGQHNYDVRTVINV